MDDFVTARPAPALAPWIERYLGYRLVGHPAGIHRGLPSRHLTFIVSIGDPIEVALQTDPAQSPATYRTVLSGLQASTALIRHGGDQEGVGIELRPAGMRALFGMPAGELWNWTAELGDVDAAGGELWARLQEATTWRERFRACDDVLTRMLGDGRPGRELVNAWNLIEASGGNAAIGQVADAVGWSRRNLTRRFRNEFGLGPKLAGQVMRFERAHGMIDTGSAGLAEAAADCGYSDQAHMSREFVRLTGLPPARLLEQRDVPFVQDLVA